MKLWRPSLLAATVLLLVAPRVAAAAPAPTAAPAPSVPPELQPWIDWVKGVELPPGECREVDEETICVWPTRLAVSVNKAGGSFDLDVTAHDADSVLLPGDDSVWPQDIKVDGKPAVVVDVDGAPSVRLAVGRHRISGVFLWSEVPDSLAVPPEVALVELRRDGKAVAFPERQEGLLRLLGDDEVEEEPEPEDDAPAATEAVEDALRVEVSRWIRDGVPLMVATRIDLRVSGRTRELTLPWPLWDDAELLRIDSDLPVHFGADRALVLQARSGSHTVTLEAALPRQLETLGPPALAEPWPADEVWVWKPAAVGEAALGQVALSGGQAVDRSRTHAPAEWEGGATFRVGVGTPLAFEVLQRGASESAPNELELDRVMWFDMDGGGWSVADVVRGRMHRGARLDLRAGALGSVIVNGKPQVVTAGVDGTSGVEVRSVDLDLRATWRGAHAATAIPLGGWSEPFDRVALHVELPRGWDVLRASGPGAMRSTWIESWRPLDLLLLLGVCVLIGRVVSPWIGLAALLGLGLAYTRSGDGYAELMILTALVTVLAALLRRDRGLAARRALQWLWLAGAAMLTAWMIWQVPVGVREVWQGGDSALAHRDLERQLGQIAEIEAAAAALVLVLVGLAWLLARTRGAGHRVAVALTVLVGGGVVLALALATTQSDLIAARPASLVEEEPPPEDWEHTDEEAGGGGQRHKGEEGKMGRPTSRMKSGLYAMKGPKDAMGQGAEVWGGVGGEEVGEAYSVGGLGLVGTGRGGGGTGEGTIGLGNTGLIGKGGDGGTGSGYGRGAGVGFGGRGTAVPTVRQGQATVSGALDRDIIRRIVRAHINEVRYCYNQGLARDPALGGRVAVNFTIGADGKVPAALVGESTLKDAAVGTCVAQAVRRWTFPAPKSGSVEVTYPFVLAPGDGGEGGDAAPADERYVLDADLPKAPPSALPQTGEGTPEWSGRRWSLDIDHAVKPDETVSLWLLSPTASKALALLRALALWIVGFALVRFGWSAGWGRTPRAPALPTATAGAARVVAVVAVLLGSLLGASQVASAAPTPELLEELERRVTAERSLAPEPECAPDCALVVRLGVEVAARTLRLRAEVHMAGPGVYRLPGSFEGWMAQTVDVDRRPAEELIAIDGVVLVRLAEGVHIIELAGPIGVDELNIGLVDEPKRVDVKAKGWVVEGIDEDGHAANLHFLAESAARSAAANDDGAADGGAAAADPARGDRVSQDLPPWLGVDRKIEIGPRWTVRTVVTRQNHGPSPITVHVPLLAGEKMIEATTKVGDPKATVSLDQAGATVGWVSVLETRDTLALTAPQGSPWTETWTVTCAEAWQCAMTGLPPTRVDAGTSVFHPWPGETLTLTLHQPPPIDGALVTVDDAMLRVKVADAGTEARLAMTVRTATVTTRTVTLPAGAHLGSVKIAGAEVPMARDATELRLPLQPGVSEVDIEWKQDDGVQTVYVAPSVSLGGPAVNARLAVDFVDDADRVLLWTGGSANGPIVWLWPWFGALALLAVALGRLPGAPLRPWKWLVLGLGFGAGIVPLIAAWFFLVAWRPALIRRMTSDAGYNALQFGYALLTAAVILVTLTTGKALLTSPVWTHVDNWSADDGLLRWYADRVADATPGAWVVSIPASLWRALWVLWALWVAWQSIDWGRWAWRTLGEGGWLRASPPPPAEDAAEQADAPATTAAPAATHEPGGTPL